MMNELIGQNLLGDVKTLIEQSRARVARSVNSELVLLYWAIGTRIRQEILGDERAEYGKQVLPELAHSLQLEYGKGFAQRNLQSMVRFAEVLPDAEILQTLSAKLSWSHLVEIIYRETPLEREFYLEMARLEFQARIRSAWSVLTAQMQAQTLPPCVAVVTHGGVISVLLHQLHRLEWTNQHVWPVPNASVTPVQWLEGLWTPTPIPSP